MLLFNVIIPGSVHSGVLELSGHPKGYQTNSIHRIFQIRPVWLKSFIFVFVISRHLGVHSGVLPVFAGFYPELLPYWKSDYLLEGLWVLRLLIVIVVLNLHFPVLVIFIADLGELAEFDLIFHVYDEVFSSDVINSDREDLEGR